MGRAARTNAARRASLQHSGAVHLDGAALGAVEPLLNILAQADVGVPGVRLHGVAGL